jgi:hypothetical protein
MNIKARNTSDIKAALKDVIKFLKMVLCLSRLEIKRPRGWFKW